jgi:hypothetical protein
MYNNNLYFGGNGAVYLADNGFNDNGNNIDCDVQAAYNNLGSPQEKTVNGYRNTIRLDGSAAVNSIVNFDYGRGLSSQTTSSTATGSFWDVALWDEAMWSPEGLTRNELIYSSGQGVDLGMRIKASLNGQQLFWYRTDYSVSVSNII